MYNSNFWLLVGTAAPVIGLAHVLALERFYGLWLRSDEVKSTLRSLLPRIKKRWASRLTLAATFLPLALSLVGLLCCMLVLLLAMSATLNRSTGNAWASYLLLTGAFITLTLQAVVSGFSAALLDKLKPFDEQG